jgi:putative nucleotidyltransferase with HDIG domain
MPLSLTPKRSARILIIDDDPTVLSLIETLLCQSHLCKTATSAIEAIEYLKEESYDLVISDIMMPGMTGLELLAEINRLSRETIVILISGNLNIEYAIEGLRRGAHDYITKPFNLAEVEVAVQRGLRHQSLIRANREYEEHLEELVGLRTHELTLANSNLNSTLERLYSNYRATLRALAAALEARDVETRGHSDRVVSYCIRLGTQIGLNDRELVTLENGALLHDIGKIGVPDGILLKRGALTEDEWSYMRRHVEVGSQILQGIDFLQGAREIVAQHHERYNGSGYPNRIEGDQICLGARIFAVADAIDAMTSDRPYRAGRPFDDAGEELIRCSGAHFDPFVVKAFTEIPVDSWREIRQLTTEGGLVINHTAVGVNTRYSLLTTAGD